MPTLSRDNIKEGIEAIGGVVRVAKLFGLGRNAVSNWYRRGFPPETYSKLAPRLRAEGYEFKDEDVFNQYRVKNRAKLARKRRKNVERRRKRREGA